jgi:hypothetical protein
MKHILAKTVPTPISFLSFQKGGVMATGRQIHSEMENKGKCDLCDKLVKVYPLVVDDIVILSVCKDCWLDVAEALIGKELRK